MMDLSENPWRLYNNSWNYQSQSSPVLKQHCSTLIWSVMFRLKINYELPRNMFTGEINQGHFSDFFMIRHHSQQEDLHAISH